jgi:choline dehydrogenase-like flavoprotein
VRNRARDTSEQLASESAKQVVVAADDDTALRDPEQLLDVPADPIWLTSAHPLGGNRISANAQAGVVSPEFRVYGHSNLYVCDASVLPASLGVDPELTLMALDRLAARRVLGG